MPKPDGFFASASRLEAHRDIKRQQVLLAGELARAVENLRALDGFEADERYRLLVRKTNESLAFANDMSAFVDDFRDKVLEASVKTGKILQEAVDSTTALLRKW